MVVIVGVLVLGMAACTWHAIPRSGIIPPNRFYGAELAAAALLLGSLGALLVVGGILVMAAGMLGLFDSGPAA